MPLEFRLLGPLVVERDGCPVRITGPRERLLLALLLLRRNEIVPRDVLVERLWSTAPAGAVHALEARISALRKRLGDDVLATRPGGYLLEVDGGLDVDRFESLVVEGRAALDAGDARRSEELLSAALACWRGDALVDAGYEGPTADEARRLEEERLTALEERAEARLAAGDHAQLVAELQAFVAAEPLRERPRRQLMLALYRSGRQAEALAVYAEARRFFVDEFGIEPSRDLRKLQRAILRQDPSLDLAPTPAPAPAVEVGPPAVVSGEQRRS